MPLTFKRSTDKFEIIITKEETGTDADLALYPQDRAEIAEALKRGRLRAQKLSEKLGMKPEPGREGKLPAYWEEPEKDDARLTGQMREADDTDDVADAPTAWQVQYEESRLAQAAELEDSTETEAEPSLEAEVGAGAAPEPEAGVEEE